jgi:DNA polymerase elongation subunit (family B)
LCICGVACVVFSLFRHGLSVFSTLISFVFSGIETVRRDNCPLVKDVITTCLQKILMERDVQGDNSYRPLHAPSLTSLLIPLCITTGAVEYAKNTIGDLLCNRLDISKLVITKSYSKKGEEYAGKQVVMLPAAKQTDKQTQQKQCGLYLRTNTADRHLCRHTWCWQKRCTHVTPQQHLSWETAFPT